MHARTRRASKELTREETPAPPLRPGRSYEDMGDEGDEGHPVDEAVERRLDHVALRRRICTATDRLMEALGEEHDLWLRLEDLLGEYRMDREATYFDIGYEHGRAAGRAEALADGKPRASSAYRAFAQRVRETVVNADLPHEEAMAALLEAGWVLVVDRETPRRGGLKERHRG